MGDLRQGSCVEQQWSFLPGCSGFCLYAAATSVHSHTSMGPRQLAWVCTWGDMMAAQCPVMDEGGGGDFPRGRLAPGSYDLSHALLSFCWAPLQSHSLQRLLSQSWGQGLGNVCLCVCVVGGGRLHPSPREPLMPEPRAHSVAMRQTSGVGKKWTKFYSPSGHTFVPKGSEV